MKNNLLIICLMAVLTACSESTQEPTKYLTINQPVDGSVFDLDHLLTLEGTGRGLYENNVVIQIMDLAGNTLIEVPTTMETNEIGGEGQWEKSFNLNRPFPSAIKITVFSPSPKDGEAATNSKTIVLMTTEPLEKTHWRLEQYLTESNQLTDVIPSTPITTAFEGNKITGNAGCNRYFGSFKLIEPTRIIFPSPMASTLMACPDDIASQEQQYLKALSTANQYQIQQDQLIITNEKEQVVLVYRYDPPITLTNTRWQATGVNSGKGGVVSGQYTHLLTAQFKDNQVRGFAGCNKFSASYTLDKNKIAIKSAVTSKKYCTDEGIYLQEKQFLQALERSTEFEITGDQLKFINDSGSLMIRFTKKE